MSNQESKDHHSKRRHKEESAIKRQQKIAKSFGLDSKEYESHYFAKHHAMNCGNPKCPMCSNPRRTWKELTIQEQREMQEMDIVRLRHDNGTGVSE